MAGGHIGVVARRPAQRAVRSAAGLCGALSNGAALGQGHRVTGGDYPYLLWLLAGPALAGLAALIVPRPMARAALAVPLLAIALSFTLLLSLAIEGWADLGGRVLEWGLGLHLPWLALVLAGSARRPVPLAVEFAGAAAFLYAGFYMAAGAASLRHGGPLAPGPAVGVILFGLLLLLVPLLAEPLPKASRRVCAGVAVLLLAATVVASS